MVTPVGEPNFASLPLLLQRALSGSHALACRAPPFGMAPHHVHMFVKATCSHGRRVYCQSNPRVHQRHETGSHSYYLRRPSPTDTSRPVLADCITQALWRLGLSSTHRSLACTVSLQHRLP